MAALADPVAANLGRLGAMLAVPPERRYADYREMLERAELDAVTIATPHHLHAEQAIDAVAAGVAVISEKPMATSVEQAEEVLAAVRRHGVPYAVVHNFLFTPGMERARALLAEGAVGTPFFGPRGSRWDFARLAGQVGRERILFGADLPYYDYRLLQQIIEQAPIDDDLKDRIAYRNMLELIRRYNTEWQLPDAPPQAPRVYRAEELWAVDPEKPDRLTVYG